MTREMNARYMDMLDEFHQKNVFVQPDGSTICHGCHKGWPCDERQLLDVFADQGRLLSVVSALHMKGYGLISELVEALEAAETEIYTEHGGDEPSQELLNNAKEYLAVGMPS